jgi:uncharacterized protein (TIGR03437 family)
VPIPATWRAFRVTDLTGAQRASSDQLLLGQMPLLVETNAPMTPASNMTLVSAASFANPPLAIGSLATINAPGLTAPASVANYTPWPDTLGGVTVQVKDSAGKSLMALLSYAGPGQVNFQVPEGMATGKATITATYQSRIFQAEVNLVTIAPGIFTANASGSGPAAAYAVTADTSGNQSLQYTFTCGSTPGSCQPATIPIGAQTVLVLYGTGVRARSSLGGVTVQFCGTTLPVQYAGPHSVFHGLDQINVALPSSFKGCGRGSLVLSVDGQSSNSVELSVN